MIASTANPPQTTQAQGGNPLVPFLNAGQGNVSGNVIAPPTGAEPNGLNPLAPGTGPGFVGDPAAPPSNLGLLTQNPQLAQNVPGAPGAGNTAAQSGGGGGMAFGGLTSPYQPYSPIGNPIYRDPRKKAPQFAAVGMGQGQTNAPNAAGGMPGAGGLA